ncbi:hypothetical protein DHX103_03525 [Planococcus sp. X10-3]
MTAIIKEEKRMDNPPKTYLQMYQEFINGYKQYKKGKDTRSTGTVKG